MQAASPSRAGRHGLATAWPQFAAGRQPEPLLTSEAEEALLAHCHEKGLFRKFEQGPCAGSRLPRSCCAACWPKHDWDNRRSHRPPLHPPRRPSSCRAGQSHSCSPTSRAKQRSGKRTPRGCTPRWHGTTPYFGGRCSLTTDTLSKVLATACMRSSRVRPTVWPRRWRPARRCYPRHGSSPGRYARGWDCIPAPPRSETATTWSRSQPRCAYHASGA